MSEPTHQEMFARLLALSAIREAQIKANPLPFLNEMATENHRLREAINEALYQLSGAANFDIAREDHPSLPSSIVKTAIGRQNRAEKVLAAAIRVSPAKEGSPE